MNSFTTLLTERQMELVKLLSQGYTYKEIGEELDIRQTTVKYHINEILRKLHLPNRAQLIAYAAVLNEKTETVGAGVVFRCKNSKL